MVSPQRPPKTILVVDDQADIRNVMQRVLELEIPGATVVTAKDGRHGLAAFLEHRPDVVLADYRMPGMDGLEMLQAIAKEDPSVPRVMMTAYPDLNIAMQAVNQARVANFFTKPITPGAVVGVVEDLLYHDPIWSR